MKNQVSTASRSRQTPSSPAPVPLLPSFSGLYKPIEFLTDPGSQTAFFYLFIYFFFRFGLCLHLAPPAHPHLSASRASSTDLSRLGRMSALPRRPLWLFLVSPADPTQEGQEHLTGLLRYQMCFFPYAHVLPYLFIFFIDHLLPHVIRSRTIWSTSPFATLNTALGP